MKPHMIQYPIAYPNCVAFQGPVACGSILVKSDVCTTIKTCEDNNK
jgi:hypothetical protein